uniref:Uncharacterized protein LOC111099963 isoform X1 n=1 Tax=Crassostrea virginica TaxID=6565 RepID=A0A8B8ABB2_CRAVI|nr:uncharacterized protein LOC111099963 isoform X1 [Crassostrea virginica]
MTMWKFCREKRDNVLSGLMSGGILTGDLVIVLLATVGLSEPVFPDTASSGHIFVFPTVMFALSGFLGLILSVYRDVMKWMLNIHAASLMMTICIAMMSFMAISNNVRTFDVQSCVLYNGTVCDCRDGPPMSVDCDTLSRLQVFVFLLIVTYLGCALLCAVEMVLDVKRMCCSDEIEDIPGVLYDYDNDWEETVKGKRAGTPRVPTVSTRVSTDERAAREGATPGTTTTVEDSQRPGVETGPV